MSKNHRIRSIQQDIWCLGTLGIVPESTCRMINSLLQKYKDFGEDE